MTKRKHTAPLSCAHASQQLIFGVSVLISARRPRPVAQSVIEWGEHHSSHFLRLGGGSAMPQLKQIHVSGFTRIDLPFLPTTFTQQ
eukprot:5730328-Prymnesium_polylepis.1